MVKSEQSHVAKSHQTRCHTVTNHKFQIGEKVNYCTMRNMIVCLTNLMYPIHLKCSQTSSET